MNFDALIEYIHSTPLTWLIITLAAYNFGMFIYEKFNKQTLLQPIIVSYVIILTIILLTNTSFEEYFKGVEIINFFLGPATVALALPLYNNLQHIKSLFIPIVVTLIVAGIFTVLIAVLFLYIFGAKLTTILAMTTKSITAPIAIITSEQIGAIPSLAIGFVLVTGILGALFGTLIFKLCRIKYETSKGFALGLVSHGVGTARAIEIGEKAAAFGALAMGLCGVVTAIFLPLIITILK
ncbi:LrgB family protein [Arcobacter porcinus]|uniref:Inner membrane protein YohK n=1 Tax=Arcobacter porcinus TaxID=1935204 RepID=A0A1C0AWS5_9BACT|nr:LrgB family protein [Arcobacter porcinus]OCL97155.1 Inner membrane protein YohK [Aliarcobacter thereius]OCL84067.1 Inner membrane protein YohK [Arcobacter porcinus]OCL89131.1 Inner membrane protein YohK [Arcobacter porcinus]OCL91551.1 Inner membrane protein YohK [Arcobacter porcinus]QEP39845.1 murein hydrolase effector protein LrgB [Arcobacter porcinus]